MKLALGVLVYGNYRLDSQEYHEEALLVGLSLEVSYPQMEIEGLEVKFLLLIFPVPLFLVLFSIIIPFPEVPVFLLLLVS